MQASAPQYNHAGGCRAHPYFKGRALEARAGQMSSLPLIASEPIDGRPSLAVLGTHTLRGAQEHGLAQRTRLGSESTFPAP